MAASAIAGALLAISFSPALAAPGKRTVRAPAPAFEARHPGKRP
jgi:hypothetical protein